MNETSITTMTIQSAGASESPMPRFAASAAAQVKEQMSRERIWTLRRSGPNGACKGITMVDEFTSCNAVDRMG